MSPSGWKQTFPFTGWFWPPFEVGISRFQDHHRRRYACLSRAWRSPWSDRGWRDVFQDNRTSKNGWHGMTGQFHQSVFGRFGGYADVNNADRLGWIHDPSMPIEPILILTLPISRNWQLIDINAGALLKYCKEVLNFNGQTTILKQTPTTNSLF